MLNTSQAYNEYDRDHVDAAIAEYERDVFDVIPNGWIADYLVAKLEDDLDDGYPPNMALKVAYAELGSIIDARIRSL